MLPTNPVGSGLFARRDPSVPDDEHKKAVRAAMVRALANQLGPMAEQFGSYVNQLGPGAAGDAQAPSFGAVPGPDFFNAVSPGAPGGGQLLYVNQETPPEKEAKGRAPDLNISSYEPDLPVPSPRPAPPFFPDEEQAGKTLGERLEKVTREEMRTGRPALGLPPRRKGSEPLGEWPIETCGFLSPQSDRIHCRKGGSVHLYDATVISAWKKRKEGIEYPLLRTQKWKWRDRDKVDRSNLGHRWKKGELSFRGDELFLKFDQETKVTDFMDVTRTGEPKGLKLLEPGTKIICNRKGGREDIGYLDPVKQNGNYYKQGEVMGHTHDRKMDSSVGPDDGLAATRQRPGTAYMISSAGAYRINYSWDGNFSVTLLAGEWGDGSRRKVLDKVRETVVLWQKNHGGAKKGGSVVKKGKDKNCLKLEPGCRIVYTDQPENFCK